MKKEYKVGILGFGFMGKAHTFGYQTMQLYYDNLPFLMKLGAVATRDEEKGKALQQEFGFEYYAADEDRIINDPNIDIIDICTPNNMHKDALIKCIKAGKNVYCEKPMVLSMEEVAEVKAAMEEYHYDKTAQVVFHNRYFPTSLRARELIDEGRHR